MADNFSFNASAVSSLRPSQVIDRLVALAAAQGQAAAVRRLSPTSVELDNVLTFNDAPLPSKAVISVAPHARGSVMTMDVTGDLESIDPAFRDFARNLFTQLIPQIAAATVAAAEAAGPQLGLE